MSWTPLPEVVDTVLDAPQPKAFTLDPAKTLVVVVDMQNQFCKMGNERSFDVIQGNVDLLAKARAAGAKVLYVQSVRWPESPNWTVYNRHDVLTDGSWRFLPGSWEAAIVDEIAPQAGEPVVQKWSHDVWAWYGLEALLEREGIVSGEWNVLVTGVSAAGCAEAAALGFANRLYKVLIPLDSTAASIEAEGRTFSHYVNGGYEYLMDFTLSSLVTFAPQAEMPPAMEAIATI